jgi:hypothetical protein
MIVKQVTNEDIERIAELNDLQKDFKLNNIDNMIIERIVMDGDKTIAYGIVKRMAEAIMLVNPEAPKLSRAKAMRELMKFAELGAKKAECAQLHCFVKDEDLAKSLERQFNFKRTHDIVLSKEV